MENKIYSINGPVVTIKGKTDLEMMEMVYVGKARLVGEVIRMNEKETTIQVYEETGGLKAGEPVESTGGPLSVTLGPGILRNIYDGIQRPLPAIEKDMGSFIERGAHEPSLDEQAKWDVTVTVKAGDTLTPGQIYATCPETPAIQHRCMVPPTVSGTVTWVAANGSYTVNEPVVKLTDAKGKEHTLTLCQKWPIRTPRPSAERMTSPRPLITGQRVIDTMLHPRRLRYRQDDDPAPDRKVVRCGHHHLCRLRRARQRDDAGAAGIQRTGRPPHWQEPDGSYRADCQHVQHACCRA